MKKSVVVQFSLDGFHFYENAPEEVSFLKDNHRHTFNFEVRYKVDHLDREREIFICRDQLIGFLKDAYGTPCVFENMSCEMIAKELLDMFREDGCYYVKVMEEDTGGAIIEI